MQYCCLKRNCKMWQNIIFIIYVCATLWNKFWEKILLLYTINAKASDISEYLLSKKKNKQKSSYQLQLPDDQSILDESISNSQKSPSFFISLEWIDRKNISSHRYSRGLIYEKNAVYNSKRPCNVITHLMHFFSTRVWYHSAMQWCNTMN